MEKKTLELCRALFNIVHVYSSINIWHSKKQKNNNPTKVTIIPFFQARIAAAILFRCHEWMYSQSKYKIHTQSHIHKRKINESSINYLNQFKFSIFIQLVQPYIDCYRLIHVHCTGVESTFLRPIIIFSICVLFSMCVLMRCCCCCYCYCYTMPGACH